jgi:hypothetical protein
MTIQVIHMYLEPCKPGVEATQRAPRKILGR